MIGSHHPFSWWPSHSEPPSTEPTAGRAKIPPTSWITRWRPTVSPPAHPRRQRGARFVDLKMDWFCWGKSSETGNHELFSHEIWRCPMVSCKMSQQSIDEPLGFAFFGGCIIIRVWAKSSRRLESFEPEIVCVQYEVSNFLGTQFWPTPISMNHDG